MSVIATIDVGTNTVLLLIATITADGKITVVDELAQLTRLGEGLAASGTLNAAGMSRTLTALATCAAHCQRHHVRRVAAVGTEALRRAANAQDFLQQVQKQTGITIEVISAPREAALTFAAAAHDFGNDIVVIDIGGGSTEIIRLVNPHDFTSGLSFVSLKLGSVTLTEQFCKHDPITDQEFGTLIDHLEQVVADQRRLYTGPTTLIATAGTATTLAAMHLKLSSYDQARVHGAELSQQGIAATVVQLKKLSIAERKKLAGLHPDRADVILAGAALLGIVMDRLQFDRVTVSDRGVRWGLLYECAAISKHH